MLLRASIHCGCVLYCSYFCFTVLPHQVVKVKVKVANFWIYLTLCQVHIN